ncbi:lipopolysaccharide biosynthesis protein [Parabacteroides acidifaciens]|uniref:Lipopolysaccharide biosynthesis protein n=1 Tax=Parabacteroides acidifaciens TaxID=2290935 RepID=A0A3D8HI19_9BACT|nr:lipopolysaccharide biosynthesis protein [Parabacteroides acidifaciens]MBC8600837.1 lipopolysaccharide biosynthesis protein [Parabacteroides acidifaciens]RDU50558.1 lipopolysaccharide biosynthesis protein [Parabacteroides acidifaciens]
MAEQTLKEKTAKGLLWGSINGGIQQILNIAFGIFLARLLSPGDYGLIGMLGIFMGIATVLQDSGFSTALINRKEINHDDYNSVFWFSFSVGIICYVILFFCAPLIADFFGHPELTNLSRVLFLWFLIGSTSIAHSAMLTKKLMVKERTKIEVCSLVVSGFVGVLLAYKGFAYWGIAIQTVTHSLVGSILRWYYVPWKPTFTFALRPLKEMYSFGVKILFTSIFAQINANIFSVLLGRFYKEDQVGYYTQGNKWMTMGYTFIWSMIGNVSLPVLSEVALDVERQRQVFRKMLRFVSFISFPAMLGLALVAPELIVIGVSDKWLPCVPVMQLLCIWGAVTPISNLYTHVLLSHGKSDIYLYSTIILGLVQLIVVISMLSLGIYYMVLAFVVVNVLWIFVWHYFVNRYIKISILDVAKDILPYCFIALIVLCITYFVTKSISNIYMLFIAKILLAMFVYGIFMHLADSVIFKESFTFLVKRK